MDKRLNPVLIKFDTKDEEFLGELVGIDEVELTDKNDPTQSKKVPRAWFKHSDGPATMILGTQLEGILSDSRLLGKTIKIIYLGEEKSGSGRKFKNFDVFEVAPDEE